MRSLFQAHWVSHEDLIKSLANDPKPYLRLAYWVGYFASGGPPVFFITAKPKFPDLANDPRFTGWEMADSQWRSLGHPAKAEAILTAHQDALESSIQPVVDVHWYIQFPPGT
jgi:hypothetical protein